MQEYEYGFFIRECSNRFLCWVIIHGIEELCYIPSSAKLSNFLDMQDKNVLLTKNHKVGRTKYTVIAVHLGEQKYIYLNLNNINHLCKIALSRDLGFNLSDISCEKRMYWGYRSDLFIDSIKPTMLELKGIISDQALVEFPQMNSGRALKQINDFVYAINENIEVWYCFVVLSPTIKRIQFKNESNDFVNKLMDCTKRGMQLKVFRINYENDFYCFNDTNLEEDLINEVSNKLKCFEKIE